MFVEYHVDIPDPDPLANADAEAQRKYYGAIATPWVLINGKAVKSPPVGGADKAQAAYAAIAKAIDDALDAAAKAKPAAKIQLDAKRKGDAVTIGGEVSDVAKADDLVLHVVLVEDAVRYQGQSGVRLHYQVARALPGGADGSPVKEGTTKIDLPVKLGDVAKAANAYLDMEMYTGPDRPLDLKKLKAVAFLQNAKTQEDPASHPSGSAGGSGPGARQGQEDRQGREENRQGQVAVSPRPPVARLKARAAASFRTAIRAAPSAVEIRLHLPYNPHPRTE